MVAAAGGKGGVAAGSVAPATGGTSAAAGVAAPAAGSGTGGVISMAGSPAMAAAGSGIAAPGTMWATGGTKSIMGAYPDPFAGSGAGSMCVLYPSQTLGPCYAQGPMLREDIREGLGGLRVRVSFLVVKTSSGCTPIPNASVDIWHSGSQGIYSAYNTGTTCNPGMEDVKSEMFCRGVQTTNESGIANFNTVFPGWYRGRTLHIRFTVRLNSREAVTSQLYFEDVLVDEILAQGDYKARGKRDTTNSSDGIFRSGGAKPEQIIFASAKRPDGVLHVWKVLAVNG